MNFLDIKVNPSSLLFSERERESRRSPVMRGWPGGVMVLGILLVQGRPMH